MTLSNVSVPVGETIQVALRVENVGERASTFRANLTANGTVVDSQRVDLEAGATETMVFRQRFDEAGTYDIAVGNRSLGTVTVVNGDDLAAARPAASDQESNRIEVIDATVPADWVKQGFETRVQATVENPADRTANRSLAVTVDGRPVANRTVTLQPNERKTVAIEFAAVGGTVAVEGVDAGRIQVSETRDDGRETTVTQRTAGGSSPGFGVLAAVLAVAGFLTVAVRIARRGRDD